MRDAALEAWGLVSPGRDAGSEEGAQTTVVLESDSPNETESIGAELASRLGEGDVVCLVGELGAGKTCFARGALRGLGVRGGGQSPSFVVERRYEGRCVVNHLDLYRIEGRESLAEIGIPDRFTEEGVFLIEWAERAAGLLPRGRIEILFADEGQTRRRLTLSGPKSLLAPLARTR